MSLNVIAEAVVTVKQKTFLLENGCSLIQGYLYSRSLPEQKMSALITKVAKQ